MSREQWVDVGGRSLELSNLEKVLYPDGEITKAEIIRYYLEIAPTMLTHLKGRPLTLIRYPNGIQGKRFFQKNAPDWTPEWIETVELGSEEQKNYLLADEQAALVWLANLAALELHQMSLRRPHFEQPDYMAFDLDPPEGMEFGEVIDTALRLREYAERFGYHPFVKTSGGKGLHLVVPLEPEGDMDAVFEASREIARVYVDDHGGQATLQLKKKARKGRILIDIYRNRTRQTMVAPYSLRARPGAPVSMPLRWEELPEIGSAAEYDMHSAAEKVKAEGDAWQGIGGYAVRLHTLREQGTQEGGSGSGGNESGGPEEDDEEISPDGAESDPADREGDRKQVRKAGQPENKKTGSGQPERHKTPAQLEEYREKRDFSRSGEPSPLLSSGSGNRFVVHRHHATRLHYDLRLEREGVLRSWAVPKGLPPRPGVKRLAVETEDHPLEYLEFEGTIPQGEYGGGEMWIYALGRHEVTREKKDGFYFRLESPQLAAEYRMHRMKEKEWLLERVGEPQVDWLRDRVEPMKAVRVDAPPGDEFLYEVKWDGIRALVALEDGQIRIHTRNGNEVTDRFPELQDPGGLTAAAGLFDGEIVCLDEEGRPSFDRVITRLKNSGKTAIQRLVKSDPVHCYLFDCLWLDGREIIGEPLERRQEWVADLVKKGTPWRVSEAIEDGEALFEAAHQHGLEGVMAKRKGSRYLAGRRSDLWRKVKVRNEADCIVVGYTVGEGDRSRSFGALHLAQEQEGALRYVGKVGTGFDAAALEAVREELEKLEKVDRPPAEGVAEAKDTVWVEPELAVEVTYARLSANGLFKEAVFVRLRPDLSLT